MIRSTVAAILAAAVLAHGVEAQASLYDYEDACDSGDLQTCSVLGLIYQTGAAGARNPERAVELYRRACGREVLAACRRLELGERTTAGVDPADERVRVGYVADASDGAPLGGAVVRVHGIVGVGERRYVSDVEGRVVLDPLPFGSHRIDVSRGGYARTDGEIPVPWEGDFLILMEEVTDGVTDRLGGVFGQITEQGSDRPVSEVDVTVSDSRGIRTISNRDGRFLLSDLEPGRIELRLQRLGYEPRTMAITVQGGTTVEVYATMAANPVELEPVEVSVASRYLQRSGFYQRSQFVTGDRFTFRDIEQMNAATVADIVRRVPGVTVLTSQIGTHSEALSNRRRGGDAVAGRCRLQPWYNGTPLVGFELELMPPEAIEAMEVYQGANVPVEYIDAMQRDGASCGVILIWTRDPRRTRSSGR